MEELLRGGIPEHVQGSGVAPGCESPGELLRVGVEADDGVRVLQAGVGVLRPAVDHESDRLCVRHVGGDANRLDVGDGRRDDRSGVRREGGGEGGEQEHGAVSGVKRTVF